MLKKTIKFEDLDGNPVEDTFYFNLNKAELMKMMVSRKGGLDSYLQAIIDAKDTKEIVSLLDGVIRESYGRRHSDNIQFVKSPEILQEFVQSQAYVELFVEFFEDENAGAAFINSIIPAKLAEEVQAEINRRDAGKTTETVQLPESAAAPEDTRPNWLKENRIPTEGELKNATAEEMRIAFQMKSAATPTE